MRKVVLPAIVAPDVEAPSVKSLPRGTAHTVRAGSPLSWRAMPLALPWFGVFTVLMVSWWNLVGADPAWLAVLKPYLREINAVITGGFFLGLLGISVHSFLPALVTAVLTLGAAMFANKLSWFAPGIFLAAGLGMARVIGPLPFFEKSWWRALRR